MMMNMNFVGTELESCSESTAAACAAVSGFSAVNRMQSNAQQFRNDIHTKEAFWPTYMPPAKFASSL